MGSLQEYSPELSDSGKTVVKGAVIGGTLAAHPELAPAYKAYKTYNVGKKLYKASDDSEKMKKTISKEGASRTAKTLSQKDASEIAQDVRKGFEQSGGTENLFGDAGSNINDETFATMLEGSIEGGLQSGAGEMAKYTVEGAM